MPSDFDQNPLNRFKALSENEQQIVQAVKGVEVRQQTTQYEFQRELFELKKKYSTVFNHLYDRRKELLLGSIPNGAELDAGEQALKKGLGDGFTAPPRNTLQSNNGVANFWLAVLMNHPGLSMVISPYDTEALQHLTDIRCTYFGGNPIAPPKSGSVSYANVAANNKARSTDPTVTSATSNLQFNQEPFGFKLFFHFSSNEYFSNDVLEKTYYSRPDQVNESGDLMYEKAVGCSISWKEGKDLTVPGADDQHGSESFFTFFSPRALPSKAELEKLNDEEFSEILDDVDGDFDCGEDIRDEIIPLALNYLLDPPLPNDGDEDDEDGDGGDSD
jgi:nucleosome assembly protein 1-like 1